jgi:S1-C subfamily serine protease
MSIKLLLTIVVLAFPCLSQAASKTSVIDHDSIALTDRITIKRADVILSINGKKMKNNVEALSAIGEMKKDAPIEMEVLRDNKIKKLVFDAKKKK